MPQLDDYRLPYGPVFGQMQLSALEEAAQGLTKDEICSLYNIEESELTENDRYNFNQAFKRAKYALVKTAVQSLKLQMQGRTGVQAALATLQRFGEAWESTDTSGAKKFTIEID